MTPADLDAILARSGATICDNCTSLATRRCPDCGAHYCHDCTGADTCGVALTPTREADVVTVATALREAWARASALESDAATLDLAARYTMSHIVGEDAARGLSWAALTQRAREVGREREAIARERYDALASNAKLTQERDAATARVAALEGALRYHARRCEACHRSAVWTVYVRNDEFDGWLYACDVHRAALLRDMTATQIAHADVLRSLATTEGG